MTPLLTIAIPTYNRLRWLSRSLSVVIDEIRALGRDDIEVLVSDNGGDDGSWPYLQELAASTPFLRVHRNSRNLGAEGNFYLLPQLATGRYLHIIGDDDILEPGALERIIAALERDPDYLVLNFDVYNADFEVLRRPNVLRVFADRDLIGQDACFSAIDAMAGCFISLWVGRREFFNQASADEYAKFYQCGMSALVDRFLGTARYTKGRILAQQCLRARESDSFVRNYYDVFIKGGAEACCFAIEKNSLSRRCARRLMGRLLRQDTFRRILYERRHGIFDRKATYEALHAHYAGFAVFWLMVVPLMYAPGLGLLASFLYRLLGRSERKPAAVERRTVNEEMP